MKWYGTISALLVLAGFMANDAAAALLNYNENTLVSLTSPAHTFTILSSSTADSLAIHATSVVVTLSSSTGGSFVLSSAGLGITVATTTGGGTVTFTCSSDVSPVAQATISQSTASSSYVVSPAAASCAPAQAGGGGFQYPPEQPKQPESTSSVPAAPTSTTPSFATSSVEAIIPHIFSRNLTYGVTGIDVNILQLLLIIKNSGPAARRLAQHGATDYFGPLTWSALVEYQKVHDIQPAAGYFGPITSAHIKVFLTALLAGKL